MKWPPAAAGLLFLLAAAPAASAATRIGNDMGGPLGKYLLRFTKLRDSGERVVIDGHCHSACTLVTMIPKERICVTSRAVLGFHAAWMDDRNGYRASSTEWTRSLFELYPPTIRRWINEHGGLSDRIILLKGQALTAIYPLCE
jgi:hypothetical protein